MFTGIIESTATLQQINKEGTNIHFVFSCSLVNELKIDQSLAHNGVCLTVVKFLDVAGFSCYQVTAIQETLNKTNLGELKIGDVVNIERCMPANGRFDGHIVQGHVDETAKCISVVDNNGSWNFSFEYSTSSKNITVEKGSICVNGVSLTVVNSLENKFSVSIIPYTYEHTSFKNLKVSDKVNLEFDIVGKYLAKLSAKASGH